MNCQNAKRLAIGTAQFGSAYGIANTTGKPSDQQVSSILELARKNHIDTLDTAIAYGDSEASLGNAGIASFDVVSKLPAVPDNCVNTEQWITEQVEASLARLRIPTLHGLLLHSPEQIFAAANGPDILRGLEQVKARGLTRKIGVSVYNPEELDRIWQSYDQFDLVQAPINLLDRRLVSSGWAERLANNNVELHARSAFLQGLLLVAGAERPKKFSRWDNLWGQWDAWLQDNKVAPLVACLQFLLALPEVNKIVVGVEQMEQLQEIIAAASAKPLAKLPITFQCEDADLINPAQWEHL